MAKNKSKVLVVEDDLALRNLIKFKLTRENFIVIVAKDGMEGLQVALNNKPDIILLDILMPIMNGIEMLKKLRQDRWGKSVPVLLLTNDTDPEHMREALKENAVDYLMKVDWNLDSVVALIKSKIKL